MVSTTDFDSVCEGSNPSTTTKCHCGGIGRPAWLKIKFQKWSVGSSPTSGTKINAPVTEWSNVTICKIV